MSTVEWCVSSAVWVALCEHSGVVCVRAVLCAQCCVRAEFWVQAEFYCIYREGRGQSVSAVSSGNSLTVQGSDDEYGQHLLLIDRQCHLVMADHEGLLSVKPAVRCQSARVLES